MRPYIFNNYRYRRVDTYYLLTTDHGSYALLGKHDFESFRKGSISHQLHQELVMKELILSSDNIKEAASDLRKRYRFICRGASLHIVVTTLRCNMACRYCHASSVSEDLSGYDMDEQTAKKTVDLIMQTPSDTITIEFQGGEPTLNWSIIEFITHYAKATKGTKKLQIILITNLSTMDDAKMNWLIDQGIVVCSSLDGPKDLHDDNRRCKHSSNHSDVTRWISKFREEYRSRNIQRAVDCLVTLTRKSLDYPREIIDEYRSLGLRKVHLRFLNNLGVAKGNWEQVSYPAEDYLRFWDEAASYILRLQHKGERFNERMVSIILSKMTTKYDPDFLDLRSPCGAAIGQLVYGHDGEIYSCDEGRMVEGDLFRLGNVSTDTYRSVVTSENACSLVNASQNDHYSCDACAYKPYCGVCPVLTYAETGTIIPHIGTSDRCKILMHQFDWVVKHYLIPALGKGPTVSR